MNTSVTHANLLNAIDNALHNWKHTRSVDGKGVDSTERTSAWWLSRAARLEHACIYLAKRRERYRPFGTL